MKRKGFSLIELTVVLFIILAFLAMSIPFFSGFSRTTSIKAAQREIQTVLNTARSYATAQSANYNVVFDTATSPQSYRITNAAGTTVGKQYPLTKGVTFGATSTIKFAANGGLASDSPNNSVTVNGQSGSRTITVDNVTGTVQ